MFTNFEISNLYRCTETNFDKYWGQIRDFIEILKWLSHEFFIYDFTNLAEDVADVGHSPCFAR